MPFGLLPRLTCWCTSVAAMRAGTDTIRKPLLWGGFHHPGGARPNTARNSLITASGARIALSIAWQLAAMNSTSEVVKEKPAGGLSGLGAGPAICLKSYRASQVCGKLRDEAMFRYACRLGLEGIVSK
jgi:hypothetical protein